MRLIEALQLARDAASLPVEAVSSCRIFIACGFTPLHLSTYIAAHVSRRIAGRRVTCESGLYGDLAGTLDRGATAQASAIAIFLEWTDLDPRLSLRQTPPSGGYEASDVVETVRSTAARMEPRLKTLAALPIPVMLSLPTLPMPGFGHQPDVSETAEHLAIEGSVNHLGRSAASAGCRVISRRTLDRESPPASRHDLKAELQSGFPYTLSHADVLGSLAARLLFPDSPKKAIITDLDNTLWDGIVGEIGPDQIAWNLDGKASVHGSYQQTLAALAAAGVLIGAASKNDPSMAEAALARPDLVIPRDRIFPVQANWRPKSESVGRILRAWNIGADAVVFVDDSPLELAEVQRAYPAITCLLYRAEDPASVEALCGNLRDLCGRYRVSEEDRLRAVSLAKGQEFAAEAEGSTDLPGFLASLGARVTFQDGAGDPRALELINKTNQFNLHGLRYTEAEWHALNARPGAFVWTVCYEDRFGALGKIAILAGQQKKDQVLLRDMVLSCRAFSRRVEYAALRCLFEISGAEAITFQYRPTDRNGPLREFLAAILDPEAMPAAEGSLTITRKRFDEIAPPLHHEIVVNAHA